MNILVVTSVYALSETDRNGSFLVASVRHLKDRGHNLTVFAPSYEGCPSHAIDGIEVHRFRYFLRSGENLTHGQGAPSRIRNPLYLFVACFYVLAGLVEIGRFSARRRFDIVHVHWPFPHGAWGLVARRFCRGALVLNFHGAELLLANTFSIVEPILRVFCRRADAIICNSNYVARRVKTLVDREISVIPFGTTVNAPARRAAVPAAPVRSILFVGRLIPRKGVDVLLEAAARVLQRVAVRIEIVGDGVMRGEWMALADSLGIGSVTTFHGFVANDELERFYSSADVFVLPAVEDDRGDTEGLGVVLVEALSFRIPIVASDVGGISDVIQHGRTGLLVPQRDASALADAVVRLLIDDELARRLSGEGLRHATAYLSWSRITANIERVYQGAIERRVTSGKPSVSWASKAE
jgi:glycosyltransferase involved in cell wall biosynthesis